MLLKFDDDGPFATGMAPYRYVSVQGTDDTPRILVQIEVDNDLKEAILDTGGQYFFCTQKLAKEIAATEREILARKVINLGGKSVDGSLCRIDLTLLSAEGDSLSMQVIAFLPDEDQEFPPNFLPLPYLGLFGCMEHVRFAIDPSRDVDQFYFGECSG